MARPTTTAPARTRPDVPDDRPSWDPPAWLAWASVGLVVLITGVVIWDSTGPAFFTDEVSTLGMARLFADPGDPWLLGGGSYLPGTAITLTPVWWISHDPATVYRLAILILAAVSVAVVWPLTRLGQSLGLTRNAAMVGASVLAVAPGHAIAANYLWGEQWLAFLVALTTWRGVELGREVTRRNAVLFGVAAALCFLDHGRAIPFSAVAGLALVSLAWRRLRLVWPAILGFGAIVAVGVVLYLWIERTLYPRHPRVSYTASHLTDASPSDLVTSLSSQTWYQSVAWAGFAAVGAAFLVGRARSGADSRFARWALGAFGAVFAFVVVLLARGTGEVTRIDASVYGRYFETFGMALAMLGVVAALRGIAGRTLAAVGGVAALAGVGVVVLVVPGIPVGGSWYAGHIPDLAYLLSHQLFGTSQSDPWIAIVFLLTLVLSLNLALMRRPKVALIFSVAYFCFVTVVTDQITIKPTETSPRSPPPMLASLDDVPEDVPISADGLVPHIFQNENGYRYWAFPRDFVLFFGTENDDPASELVYAPTDWQPAIDAGALPLNGSRQSGQWIWVYPGELFDRLDAEGRLAHPVVEDADS